MDSLEGKLIECFAVVFPELAPAEVHLASVSTVPTWDSMVTVNLVAVIEEQFGIQLELDELTETASFASILELLRQRNT
jgi:acyl carrier protein